VLDVDAASNSAHIFRRVIALDAPVALSVGHFSHLQVPCCSRDLHRSNFSIIDNEKVLESLLQRKKNLRNGGKR